MTTIPDMPTLCRLEVLVMPNGEILCAGQSIGWFNTLKKYLTVATT